MINTRKQLRREVVSRRNEEKGEEKVDKNYKLWTVLIPH